MYTGHDAPVKHVTWLDRDQHLASQSDDKSVHVWEKATGKRTLPKECRPVLVIGSWNGLVLKNADFSGAVGLSDMNKQLITQREGNV
jgi:WD40 repeat protein